MARVKSIAQKRHRKIKAQAKGFKHARSRRLKSAKEAVMHAGQYAYIGRKLRKRDLRSTWILRLNAASRLNKTKYSELIKKLKDNKVEIDRKILSDIAVSDPEAFTKIIESLK